jgi:hypothetical protein
VAKGKRSPALFEVINRAQTQGHEPRLQIPQWWRNNREEAEADKNLGAPTSHEVTSPDASVRHSGEVQPSGQVASDEVELSGISQAAQTDEPSSRSIRRSPMDDVAWTDEPEAPHAEPAVEDQNPEAIAGWVGAGPTDTAESASGDVGVAAQSADGPVGFSFSLDAAGIVIAVGVVSLLIAAGFFAGNKLGYDRGRQEMQAQVVDSVEQASKMRPDGSVLSVGNPEASVASAKAPSLRKGAPPPPASVEPTAPKPAEAPAPARVARQVGWNYLLIQHFRGSDAQEEAAKAERFICSQLPPVNGQPPVSVEPHPDGGYMLLSAVGYSSGDSAAKEAFHRFQQSIVNVGKLYRQRGGGYDFRNAYPMKLSRLSNSRRK